MLQPPLVGAAHTTAVVLLVNFGAHLDRLPSSLQAKRCAGCDEARIVAPNAWIALDVDLERIAVKVAEIQRFCHRVIERSRDPYAMAQQPDQSRARRSTSMSVPSFHATCISPGALARASGAAGSVR